MFSNTRRPSKQQDIILRSFILMCDSKITSSTTLWWKNYLTKNPVIRASIGLRPGDKVPFNSISCHKQNLLQQIFADLVVSNSANHGFLDDTSDLTVSADGTCISTGASSYGRTFYTKPDDDIRLFTPIPHHSKLFKTKMNSCTACERANNRILHNYKLEGSKIRGKSRLSFFTFLAATNIHLDLWLKQFDFSILDLLYS